MPALLSMVAGTAAMCARGPFGQLECGEFVNLDGRLYFVLGFDPAGTNSQRVYLEDTETHQPRTAALAELLHLRVAVDEPRQASAA